MMTKSEAIKAVKERPDIVEFCKDNFWKIVCPDECPHYELCKSWDFDTGHGIQIMYPGSIEFYPKIKG